MSTARLSEMKAFSRGVHHLEHDATKLLQMPSLQKVALAFLKQDDKKISIRLKCVGYGRLPSEDRPCRHSKPWRDPLSLKCTSSYNYHPNR